MQGGHTNAVLVALTILLYLIAAYLRGGGF
jgi:hypothetical protein